MRRVLRSLFRIAATGMVLLGGMGLALEFARHRLQQAGVRHSFTITSVVLLVLGIVVFSVSGRLARRLAEDSEDDEPS